jgi:hypothetical protein
VDEAWIVLALLSYSLCFRPSCFTYASTAFFIAPFAADALLSSLDTSAAAPFAANVTAVQVLLVTQALQAVLPLSSRSFPGAALALRPTVEAALKSVDPVALLSSHWVDALRGMLLELQGATGRSLAAPGSAPPPQEPAHACALNAADLYDAPLLRVVIALLLSRKVCAWLATVGCGSLGRKLRRLFCMNALMHARPLVQEPALAAGAPKPASWAAALSLASELDLDAGLAADLCSLLAPATSGEGAGSEAASGACVGLVWAWHRFAAAAVASGASKASEWASLPFSASVAPDSPLRAAASDGLRALSAEAARSAARVARPAGLRLQPLPTDNPFVKALLAAVRSTPGLSEEDATYTTAGGPADAAAGSESDDGHDDADISYDSDSDGEGSEASMVPVPPALPLSDPQARVLLALHDAFVLDTEAG